MKILIVEDDYDSRLFLERWLNKQGYTVFTAGNGVEALACARKTPPDLVISDVMMPEMDGFELCRKLKVDEQLQSIPVIFYTATFVDRKDEQLAMAMGAVRYLIKPMESEELLAIIREVLDSQQEGRLPAPEEAPRSDEELSQMYSQSLARKLEKKVRQLEAEHQALQQSEEKYRRLVEMLQDEYLFYSHDTQGVFTYMSPSVTRMLGYSQQEFMTHYQTYLTDNPVNAEVERNTEAALRGEEQPLYQLEIFHKDGTRRWMEVKEVPVLDRHGQVLSIEGIAHDITERKLTEAVLAGYRENLEELIKERTASLEDEIRERQDIEEELRANLEELEWFNKLMVERELRMVELKKEVNTLASQMGEGSLYPEVEES